MANTPRARALGQKLRQRREEIGLSLEEVGAAVGWSKATISRIERGERDLTEPDASALLVPLRIVGADRQQVLKMAREIHQPVWWEVHRGLPSVLTGLIDAEQRAHRIVDVATVLIPGLLQTRAYTRSLFEEAAIEPHHRMDAVSARQTRQDILERGDDPVDLTAYIDEMALLRPVGGPRVLADQLHHLTRVARWPNIAIRILPLSLGVHRGIDGQFMLLELPFGEINVHAEAANAGFMLDKPEDVAPFQGVVDRLKDMALDADESVSLIADYARKQEQLDEPTIHQLA